MNHFPLHHLVKIACFLLLASSLAGAEADLVNVRSIDSTIVVDLRYAGTRNIAQRPLYPSGMPALLRPSVARKLAAAQAYLRERGYGIKIWDAYRPKAAHDQLWQYARNNDYVADPADPRGSLHTWGVAIDATLVDKDGKEMEMPTDFDSFTPAAMLYYKGPNEKVRRNVHRLQSAMAIGGFYGLRTEWWHFVDKDWQKYRAIPEVVLVPQSVAAIPAATPPAGAANVRSSSLQGVSHTSGGTLPATAANNAKVLPKQRSSVRPSVDTLPTRR